MRRIPLELLENPEPGSDIRECTTKAFDRRTYSRIRDLTGQKFGLITVVKPTNKRWKSSVIWVCECACSPGVYFGAKSSDLINGDLRSCGCAPKTKHKVLEDQYDPDCERLYLYRMWYSLRSRCANAPSFIKRKTPKVYAQYNICLCDEWADFDNFYFWALDNGYKVGSALHRHDLLGNYSPENCYWVEYGRRENNHPGSKIIEYDGRAQCVSAWAREMGIPASILRYRLSTSNWDLGEVLSKEWIVQPRNRRKKTLTQQAVEESV